MARGTNTVDSTSDDGMGDVGSAVVCVHSHNSSGSDSGVVTNNVGSVGHALADLVTLGGDHLLAVLDGGHVHVLGTDSPGHTSSEGEDDTEEDTEDCYLGVWVGIFSHCFTGTEWQAGSDT